MTVLGFNTIWLKLVLLNSSVSESDSDFISEGCMVIRCMLLLRCMLFLFWVLRTVRCRMIFHNEICIKVTSSAGFCELCEDNTLVSWHQVPAAGVLLSITDWEKMLTWMDNERWFSSCVQYGLKASKNKRHKMIFAICRNLQTRLQVPSWYMLFRLPVIPARLPCVYKLMRIAWLEQNLY